MTGVDPLSKITQLEIMVNFISTFNCLWYNSPPQNDQIGPSVAFNTRSHLKHYIPLGVSSQSSFGPVPFYDRRDSKFPLSFSSAWICVDVWLFLTPPPLVHNSAIEVWCPFGRVPWRPGLAVPGLAAELVLTVHLRGSARKGCGLAVAANLVPLLGLSPVLLPVSVSVSLSL